MSTSTPSWDPGRTAKRSRIIGLMRLVRIEHTLFSLPFAYAGALLACSGGACLSAWEAFLILLAVFGLRTAGMAYNNIADLDIDRLNPRTMHRPLVTGAVSIRDAWLLVVLGSLVYYASAALLNVYALLFSPVLWILAITYPYAKRYYSLAHLHLGFVLGSVVFGGAVASYGDTATSLADLLAHVPWAFVVGVALWVAGFDSYYALLDYEFDLRMGLHSLPVALGPQGAITASRVLHTATGFLFAASVPLYGLGIIGCLGIAAGVILLVYQHYLLTSRGIEAVPRAFNTNLALGVVVGLAVVIDRLLGLLAAT